MLRCHATAAEGPVDDDDADSLGNILADYISCFDQLARVALISVVIQ